MQVAGLVAAMEPDILISSDLQRARQTAEMVASLSGLPLQLDRRLRERNLGHWEGFTREEVAERYPDEFADWLAGRDVSRLGGESRQDVAQRAMSLMAEIPQVGVAVLVSHGATAMSLTSALLGLPQTPSVLGPLANCHWTELRRDDGGSWMLRAHNAGPPGPVIPLLVSDADVGDADA
jgi:glucosyl-3-phosphoglycerate phosphatase